ncbi:hypothetical protein BURPSS13_C0190 [Burkholderia pseudomallei S13]|nr:hypothetical protein BURPSS13_C0190 [Burkholderia pseudomallei S13]
MCGVGAGPAPSLCACADMQAAAVSAAALRAKRLCRRETACLEYVMKLS